MSLIESTTTAGGQMTRAEIRAILKRHPGSLATLADELEVTTTVVSSVLRNRANSDRVLKAAEKRARKFLEREAQNAA